MNKQQLASKIWESANKMRSKIEANEYKDYILGFIFYKFLSDSEVKFLKQQGYENEDIEDLDHADITDIDYIKNNIGYFIAYSDLFSTWIKMGSDFNSSLVTDAISNFNRNINPSHKKVFEKIFDTLATGLSKLGETSGSRTKAIRDLIYLIKDIPMDEKQDYDVLGFIYEYLIGNFAANAGKKAGEFYTPHEVSMLMSEIVASHLKDRREIMIYDPTSGSGSLLINIGKCVSKYLNNRDSIKYYAQELKENTYNLTRMNLVMRGIKPDNIVTRNGDTLEEDWPFFDENHEYSPLYVDAVVSNPPYSQVWSPEDKDNDARFKDYGIAPKGKADYAFLLHDLYHLKPDGIMTIVLPHGVLFRGNEEGNIRKNLIEHNNIDAIIGLPPNIFFGTGIPTIIMVLKKNRPSTDVLIIDASKGFEKQGKNNVLRASDIKRIVDTVNGRKSVDKFSKVVTRDEIRSNDYNLNIPRYVDSSDKTETWDIFSQMYGGIPNNEIDELKEYWDAFPTLKSILFKDRNSSYSDLKVENLKEAINSSIDVKNFYSKFSDSFKDFADYLTRELVDNMETLNISKEESVLSDDIFSRLSNIPLIDKYEAYELLDKNWKKISIDLEIIQTEDGHFNTIVRQTDPKFVFRKKDGKDQEVQEGYVGHLIPFELVQETLLKDGSHQIKQKEDRLNEIASLYEELIEELPEDELDKSYINESKDAFVPSELKKAIKSNSLDKSVLSTLKKADALIEEEKQLKRDIKTSSEELQKAIKDKIENLTDDEAFDLIKLKWINPILEDLNKLPEKAIENLITKLDLLSHKYDSTLEDIEKEIKETQDSLIEMLNNLTGSEYDMMGIEELKKLLGGK